MHQYLFTYLNQKYGLKVNFKYSLEFDDRSCRQYHIGHPGLFCLGQRRGSLREDPPKLDRRGVQERADRAQVHTKQPAQDAHQEPAAV